MKKKISIVLKFCISFLAILGVVIACVFAQRDGYSPWYKRLYYFTLQSNIWMSKIKNKSYVKNYMYILQFIFTISITITGVIFWSVIAPFTESDYNDWSFTSIITHIVVPLLAIVNFFIDDYPIIFKKESYSIFYYSTIFISYFFFDIVNTKNWFWKRGNIPLSILGF